ncbi:hypothetical protein ACFSTD_20635 [Novosphingobium colocasiae]
MLFLVALDAQTGKELWRFYTLPRKGGSRFRYLGWCACVRAVWRVDLVGPYL